MSIYDRLYEEGLRCYKKCFMHMKEHWSDFNMKDADRKAEWKNLLLHFKHKIMTMRISEMRAEIHALWEACYLSEADKREWTAFEGPEAAPTESTEHKLCKIRQELANLRAYNEKHKELIHLVRKYEEAEKSLDVLGQDASAHDRLANRGALLLKEEQQRRLLTKVPQMQKVILKMIREKELDGDLFLIRGETFQTIIDRNKRTFQMKPRYKQSMSLQRGGGVRSPPLLASVPHTPRRHQARVNSISPFKRGYASC